jgi:hypothetical protein
MNDLRRKVLYLAERQFLSCFECVETGFPYLREPGSVNQLHRVRLVGVPADCIISRVWYDYARMAFGILLHHPSFDELPVGADPEVVFVETTIFRCDHEGKSLCIRDAETYEPVDMTRVEEVIVCGRQMTAEVIPVDEGFTLRRVSDDVDARYLKTRQPVTPGVAAVQEQVASVVERRDLTDVIEGLRHPEPPA